MVTHFFAKLLVFTTLLASLIFVAQPNKVSAAGNLELARDTVSVLLPEATNIGHEVYFVLPSDATQIRNTDWITITLTNYQDVNVDSAFITGGFGSPSISLSGGNKVKITGLVLLPGTPVAITNIMASNPAASFSNLVELQISEDVSATIVRNSATLVPSDSKNSVNVTATILSPLSALTAMGYTAPNSFVTITENTTVIATTVADGTGQFTFNLTAITPGAHSFQIFSTDSLNRGTAQTSLNVYLVGNTLSTATGIILSSTVGLSTSAINPGQALTITGSAKPNSQINIFVEAPLRTYTATSGSNGDWTYTISALDTADFTPGEYRTYVVVQDGLGNQSVVSSTLTFTVNAPSDPSNPSPACDISHGDLNCNGTTNLTDFSILLYHWNTNHKVADINGDTFVNLVDFSIMMFYYVQ